MRKDEERDCEQVERALAESYEVQVEQTGKLLLGLFYYRDSAARYAR